MNVEYVSAGEFGLVPVLPLRMMSDERKRELGRLSAQAWEEAGMQYGSL